MRTLILASLLAVLACTPSTTTIVPSVVEVTCLAITSVDAPTLEGICVPLADLTVAISAYVVAHGGAAPSISSTGAVSAELFTMLSAAPGVRKLSAVKRCPTPPGKSP